MTRGPVATDRLVWGAWAALTGDGGVDAQAAQQALANAAKALARALPVRDKLHDLDLDGPLMSPEEVKAAAVKARSFLELVADLLGSPNDPDWMGDDFAFLGALKRRPDWKPKRGPSAAKIKRQKAAARVYELMAKQFLDTGRKPKQEAAVAAVMEEQGLARSKVMAALREYRADNEFLGWLGFEGDDPLQNLGDEEIKRRAHFRLAQRATHREWFTRNPDARFLFIPAGSEMEKQLLTGMQSP